MKKGISLIVLVITIIVMIIIAGAIILSLNSSNIIDRADQAVTASDLANLKSALTLEYAEIVDENHDDDDTVVTQDQATTRYQAIYDANFSHLTGYSVSAASNLAPVVSEVGTTTDSASAS